MLVVIGETLYIKIFTAPTLPEDPHAVLRC